MTADPRVRSDGLCARPGCEKRRVIPDKTYATREQHESDAFCSRTCLELRDSETETVAALSMARAEIDRLRAEVEELTTMQRIDQQQCDDMTEHAGRMTAERDEARANAERLRDIAGRAERFLRNGSGYKEEIADWLHDYREALRQHKERVK